MRLCSLVAVFVTCAATTALAADVVIVADKSVRQYSAALTGALSELGSVPVISPSQANFASQLKGTSPAVVLAVGKQALTKSESATQLPVVYCMVLGARDSKRVTGVRLEVDAGEQLTQLRSVHPKAKTIGLVYHRTRSAGFVASANAAAGKLGLTLNAIAVTGGSDVRPALDKLWQEADALWLPPDVKLYSRALLSHILTSGLSKKKPVFGFLTKLTKVGALASVAPDYGAAGRKAAQVARGIAAKPAGSRLPVPPSVAGPGELSVNLKVATKLGVSVPSSAVSGSKEVFK